MDHKTDNEITYRKEDGYLQVTVSGPWNLVILEAYIIDVRQKANRFGYLRVLVDNRELVHPAGDSFERFKIGEVIAREWGPYIQVAVLTRPENISGYTEDTAVNRGANFAVFADIEEAKEWLLK